MQLKLLSLTNFKNIAEARLMFSGKVNCFLGNNGMGKSNLLDAIYFLSFCKSFSRINDRMLIRRGEEFAIVRGEYIRKGIDEELIMGLSASKRKTLKRGGKEYDRLSSHIGNFPLVMVAPQDIDLIRESGEERRHWMDVVISQSDPVYLDNLIRYTRALEQRNRLLREGSVDPNLYGAVEIMLEMSGSYIHNVRAEWINKLSSIFDHYYAAIAGSNGEHVSLTYQSQLNRPGITLSTLIDEARRHDEIVKHTSVGIHRDDIDMQLDGMPMRRTGSQGQCKTFTIALRLAQYDFLHSSTGIRPLLLLDDIFDKLDATRVERIMGLVTGDSFGQIFITDTNRTHLDEIMSRTGGDYRMWSVENGIFTPTHS
ncbi:MAG: DNA replication and repair protein RecF [Duncaniella sp.]|nr:DNA replication and repair protein RecF [Muribaculum sp.]MCM1255083.1 DNA replication and repair protein RecF [Duncaniella sp.]